jgi:micrococcal nuclease
MSGDAAHRCSAGVAIRIEGRVVNRVVKVGLGLVAVVGVGVGVAVGLKSGTSVIGIPQPPPGQAEVATLVDGGTVDVRFDDQITRVRLGSIAAPGLGKPDRPRPCLASEASALLGTIIPAGTQLKLTYDRDQLGRTVAQAVTLDGRLVNAEVVRAGLATVVDDAPATSVPPALVAAAHEALDNKRGMHDADIACTVPGQVKVITDQVAKVATAPPPGADVAVLVAAANSATDARMAAEELDSEFTQNRQEPTWLVLDATERSQLQARVETARDQAAAAETVLREATNIRVNQDATQTATQTEAARIAKALASIRKAEAQRAAEAARRAQAARKAQAYAAAEAQARAEARRKSQAGLSQSSSSNDSSHGGSGSSGSSGKKKEKKNGDSSGP